MPSACETTRWFRGLGLQLLCVSEAIFFFYYRDFVAGEAWSKDKLSISPRLDATHLLKEQCLQIAHHKSTCRFGIIQIDNGAMRLEGTSQKMTLCLQVLLLSRWFILWMSAMMDSPVWSTNSKNWLSFGYQKKKISLFLTMGERCGQIVKDTWFMLRRTTQYYNWLLCAASEKTKLFGAMRCFHEQAFKYKGSLCMAALSLSHMMPSNRFLSPREL